MIAKTIHYSIPVLMAALSVVFLGVLLPNSTAQITTNEILICSRWLLVSLLGLYVLTNLSKALATSCYRALNEYGMFVPFQMTRGDENRIQKIEKGNKKKMVSFCINSGVALALNIAAGIIVWILLPKP